METAVTRALVEHASEDGLEPLAADAAVGDIPDALVSPGPRASSGLAAGPTTRRSQLGNADHQRISHPPIGSSVMSDQLPTLATPPGLAEYLHTTTASLAQDRYRGTGPKFIKRGSRVLYRWSDVLEWLDRNTFQRTDDPRQQR